MSRRDDNNLGQTDRRTGAPRGRARAARSLAGEEGSPGGPSGVSAERRRRRRPGRILGMWARIGLLSGTLLVLLLIAVAIVAKAIRPYAEASQLQGQLAGLNRQVAATKEQNADYQRRLAYLRTPQGEMTEARSLGYLVPGEVPVVVDGTPGALSETPLATPPPSKPSFMSSLRIFLRSITGRR